MNASAPCHACHVPTSPESVRCDACGVLLRAGSFVILSVRSQGESRVYVAQDERGEKVFLRELGFRNALTDEQRLEFENRAKALSQIRDPAVPPFVAAFWEGEGADKKLYLAQTAGRDLPLRSAERDEPLLIQVVQQVLAALKRLPVRHGDLSLDNVLITPSGEARLVNFSLVGEGDDLGAIGNLCVELLCGRPARELNRNGVPAWESFVHCRPGLRKFLRKSLAVRPADRFANIDEAIAAIEVAARQPATMSLPMPPAKPVPATVTEDVPSTVEARSSDESASDDFQSSDEAVDDSLPGPRRLLSKVAIGGLGFAAVAIWVVAAIARAAGSRAAENDGGALVCAIIGGVLFARYAWAVASYVLRPRALTGVGVAFCATVGMFFWVLGAGAFADHWREMDVLLVWFFAVVCAGIAAAASVALLVVGDRLARKYPWTPPEPGAPIASEAPPAPGLPFSPFRDLPRGAWLAVSLLSVAAIFWTTFGLIVKRFHEIGQIQLETRTIVGERKGVKCFAAPCLPDYRYESQRHPTVYLSDGSVLPVKEEDVQRFALSSGKWDLTGWSILGMDSNRTLHLTGATMILDPPKAPPEILIPHKRDFPPYDVDRY